MESKYIYYTYAEERSGSGVDNMITILFFRQNSFLFAF